jgi:GDP-mannose 6-dehydrogenase
LTVRSCRSCASARRAKHNGSLKLDFVRKVCEEIGAVLRRLDRYHVVVIRSTILPGTMRSVVIPTLEASSGKRAGQDFGVCFNPEFLREGTAVNDYHHPPKTVIGESDGMRAPASVCWGSTKRSPRPCSACRSKWPRW